jgi:putative ABC transport system permease protein
VGVRKVAGASKKLLIIQFLIESVCTAFVSFFISILALAFFLPFINQLMSSHLVLFSQDQWPLWLELIATTIFIGLVAGLYPAFYLSSFRSIKVLKGKFTSSYSGAYLRRGLVVFQFLISIVLIISFFTIYRQVDFVMQKNLGFNKNNILLLPNIRGGSDPGAMVDELKKISDVASVARADGILGGQNSTNGVESKGRNDHILLNFMRVDHSFLPTLQIELKEGRNFFNSKSDSMSIILNEKAIAELGLKKPYLGQQIEWDDQAGHSQMVNIIGVAKDFHFTSLHEPIKAFGFVSEENNGSAFFLKLRSQNLAKTIATIQQVWTKYNPDKPFEYTFQDEQIAKLYQSDIKFKNHFSSVTLLAISIACLGLLGLSVFTAESRAKEIGIRKVLGASVTSLFTLLSKDFLWLIVISIAIASPIAWWSMHNWLQGFAYRVDISWWLFAVSGLTAISIALLTVSFQAMKAAVANPVTSLRTE